jgi:hypothetical protein
MDNKETGALIMDNLKAKLNRELMGKIALAERYLSATDVKVMKEVLEGEFTIEQLSQRLDLPQYTVKKSMSRINKFVTILTTDEGRYFIDTKTISDVVTTVIIGFSVYVGVIAILF